MHNPWKSVVRAMFIALVVAGCDEPPSQTQDAAPGAWADGSLDTFDAEGPRTDVPGPEVVSDGPSQASSGDGAVGDADALDVSPDVGAADAMAWVDATKDPSSRPDTSPTSGEGVEAAVDGGPGGDTEAGAGEVGAHPVPGRCVVGTTRGCYPGPSATRGVGRCRDGTQRCETPVYWSACVGAALPEGETCNGMDDDCNGRADDGEATCGVGACRRAVPVCTSGLPTPCAPGAPVPETCNGIDDDCDGAVDELLTRECCTSAQCIRRQGVCRPGRSTCREGVFGAACVDEVLPGPERCDGEDTDCDGVDDDTDPDAAVECSRRGTRGACRAGRCAIVACTEAFQDCDGVVGNGCEADLQASAAHCGACGNACAEGQVCVAGRCDAVREVAAGAVNSCARLESGRVLCWGFNDDGQLGDGTVGPLGIPRTTPVPVLGLDDAITVAVGDRHACALRRGGTVTCWGSSSFGQLGDGTTRAMSPRPVAVRDLVGAVQLALSHEASCARLDSGAVACWGRAGVLGDGTLSPRATGAGRVRGLDDAVDLAAGGDLLSGHACAVRRSGAVVCWGANVDGQLGNGALRMSSMPYETAPVAVVGLTDAVRLAAGWFHTCAVRRGGTVQCWGNNAYAHLGDSALGSRPFPTTVLGIADAEAVTAGRAHSCARRRGGAVVCWGDNREGQIGDGTVATFRLAPVAPVGVVGVQVLAAGAAHTCALVVDRLRCWGANAGGQLGDGTLVGRGLPAAVTGL